MKILGISGSLRRGSYNTALLRAAAARAPEIEVVTLEGIPLYDGDVEAAGFPAAVTALQERIAAADGLLVATPEYNHSLPGVLKNGIDWLSRPAGDIPRIFGECPIGLVGATPGPGGTRLAQGAWLPVFGALGLRVWLGRRLFVTGARDVFDANGAIVDAKTDSLLTRYLEGLVAFVTANRRAP